MRGTRVRRSCPTLRCHERLSSLSGTKLRVCITLPTAVVNTPPFQTRSVSKTKSVELSLRHNKIDIKQRSSRSLEQPPAFTDTSADRIQVAHVAAPITTACCQFIAGVSRSPLTTRHCGACRIDTHVHQSPNQPIRLARCSSERLCLRTDDRRWHVSFNVIFRFTMPHSHLLGKI